MGAKFLKFFTESLPSFILATLKKHLTSPQFFCTLNLIVGRSQHPFIIFLKSEKRKTKPGRCHIAEAISHFAGLFYAHSMLWEIYK